MTYHGKLALFGLQPTVRLEDIEGIPGRAWAKLVRKDAQFARIVIKEGEAERQHYILSKTNTTAGPWDGGA